MFRCCYILFPFIVIIHFSSIQCQTCATDQCPKSVFNENLVLTPDQTCYDIGDQVNLTCSGNLGGPDNNMCGSGGSFQGWTLPIGTTCEVFTCSRPDTGEGLILNPDKNSYSARESVTYSCKEGYSLTGATKATCDSQDSWNPPSLPVCLIFCPEPTIPHGNVTSSGPFLDGNSYEVECDDNYSLEAGSSSTINCEDGSWSSIPTCFASCDVPDVSNGNVTSRGPLKHGETAEVNCDAGYTLDGTSQATITCQDGTWDPVPECLGSCDIPAVSNGGVTGTGPVRHGETATVDCDEGYTLNGTSASAITCQDGAWEPVPECYGSCYLPAIPNLDAEAGMEIIHETQTSIQCEAGYSYEQQTVFAVSCNNGTLEGDIPDECHQDCDTPEPPSQGSVSGGYRHGETVTYECNEGYILDGDDTATCTDGTWSADVPTCFQEEETSCEAPEGLQEGLILVPEKNTYNVDDIVTYSCPEGKSLKGPEKTTCTESGEWQPPDPPVCHGEMLRGNWSSFLIVIFSTLLALKSM